MSRRLTPHSSLENFKREAKQWLKALRDGDHDARARLASAFPQASDPPSLRDVQHALAREHGLPNWADLRRQIEQRGSGERSPRDETIEALLAAANDGDAARVTELLDAHPDIVNECAVLRGHTGKRSALHFAINSKSDAVVDALLARGADPNLRDEGDNALPLHFAAENGLMSIVHKLVEHGSDTIGAGDLHGDLQIIGWATCFDYAYHADVATYLLEHGARHTIFSAVAMGATDAIRENADHIDDRMDRTNHHRTPLHLAIVKRRPESVAALLDVGANTEIEDSAGLTPLDQAALTGTREMATRLLEHGAQLRLPASVAFDRQGDIDRLLREEPDALRPGGRWDRLIIRASETASGDVIETLIRHGASVHVRDSSRTSVDSTHGFTALHAAAFRGNLDAARVLLRHGAHTSVRDDKYWGTAAGWAAYARHTAVRDLILDHSVDAFDAIEFDRLDRLKRILDDNPTIVERQFGQDVSGNEKRDWVDPHWTPLAYAEAKEKHEAVRLLRERSASLADAWVDQFLRAAALDWRTGGPEREVRMHDAARILGGHPEIARANIYTAVVCGELADVRRILDERPEAASAVGGPRLWPPLLYLAATRLPDGSWSSHAMAIARLLLDRGSDPNAFYPGGNTDIHYTVLTTVLGRGEERASMHAQARALTRLLLERGADPHDNQVIYNVFADNTSRVLLDNDIVWLLELMHEFSARRGHQAQWDDPAWPMFDLTGAPSLGDEVIRSHGAYVMLHGPVDRNLLPLAEWMLKHGAGPNTPAGAHRPTAPTLYRFALTRGHREMAELLAKYGAVRTPAPPPNERERFIEACLRMDRSAIERSLSEHPEFLRDPKVLFAAVERDRDDVVAMLLDLGMSPNLQDPSLGQQNALHTAAIHGSVRAAKLLIERGTEVDHQEMRFGGVPMGWARWSDQREMMELLARRSRYMWGLVYNGWVDRVRTVLAEDPTLAHGVNGDGETLLMWLPSDTRAAMEIAKLLLEHGADPSRRSTSGVTASEIAKRRGMDEVAALIKDSAA